MLVATDSRIERWERMWVRRESGRVLIMSGSAVEVFFRVDDRQLLQDLVLAFLWFISLLSALSILSLTFYFQSASDFELWIWFSMRVCVCFALRKWVSTEWKWARRKRCFRNSGKLFDTYTIFGRRILVVYNENTWYITETKDNKDLMEEILTFMKIWIWLRKNKDPTIFAI